MPCSPVKVLNVLHAKIKLYSIPWSMKTVTIKTLSNCSEYFLDFDFENMLTEKQKVPLINFLIPTEFLR